MSWVLYLQLIGLLLIGYILVVAGAAHLIEKRYRADREKEDRS